MLKPAIQATDVPMMDVIYKFPSVDRVQTADDGPKKGRGGIVFLCCLLMIAFLSLGWSGSGDREKGSSMTAEEIRSMVIETATRRPENSIHPNGGVLGSWWIYATESAGDSLLGLCLESRTSHIGASRAFVMIDVEENSLSFVLENAVVAVLPDSRSEGSLDQYDSLEIGPIPLTVDVIQDDTIVESSMVDAGIDTDTGF